MRVSGRAAEPAGRRCSLARLCPPVMFGAATSRIFLTRQSSFDSIPHSLFPVLPRSIQSSRNPRQPPFPTPPFLLLSFMIAFCPVSYPTSALRHNPCGHCIRPFHCRTRPRSYRSLSRPCLMARFEGSSRLMTVCIKWHVKPTPHRGALFS